VEFRILGPVEVVQDGRTLSLGRSRERAVLALLLLSANRVVSAEHLVDELWAGEPPDGAIQALRVFVSRLRKTLREAGEDDVIVTEPAGYVARVPAAALDAARFEALVSAGRKHAARGDHQQAAATLAQALALWRGPALADVGDSSRARAEAARLEESRLAALEERIEADLACGRHHDLVAELDAHTRAHPLRERLWAQRMIALYRSGRQADALRAYQDVRAILGEELGLEPSGPLADLEGAILRHEPHLDLAEPAGGVAEPPGTLFARRTPYVGRETERAELSRLLESARHGEGAVVMIGGEPGVGKTRLTEEIGAEATRRGMAVHVGRCYETEGAPPYVAFVEILELMLARAPSPAAFLDALGEDAPEVARLLPHLRRLFPDLPPPIELPPEQERRYLFNCLRDCFAREAAARPLLLILDDLHWADEPTLLFLEHLADRIPGLPLLAVGTYRDTEVTASHRLARTLDGLLRSRLAHRMGLRRLSEGTVAALLKALSGQEPPASLVKVIHGETEGNPFFVEEVFKHLAEEDRLFGPDGRFRPEIALGEFDVPETVRIVLGRRLERLTEDSRRALSAAAVVGRAFTFELLEALGELDSPGLLDALDEAEQARLVAPVSDRPGEDRLFFAHELIRQTLLTGLSQPRRRRLHLRVAEAMEEINGGSLEDRASEIAHHLESAGPAVDRAKLLRYLILAGRRALTTAGFEEALRHFERAVLLRNVAEPRQLADLLFDLGLARCSSGMTEEALEAWQEALGAHERRDDPEGLAEVCFKASEVLWWVNRDEEAFRLAQRGVAVLGERPTPLRARMLGWSGAAVAFVSPYEVGAGMIDEALALADLETAGSGATCWPTRRSTVSPSPGTRRRWRRDRRPPSSCARPATSGTQPWCWASSSWPWCCSVGWRNRSRWGTRCPSWASDSVTPSPCGPTTAPRDHASSPPPPSWTPSPLRLATISTCRVMKVPPTDGWAWPPSCGATGIWRGS
jgi:DNA-binding SARP family transcriptional activator